MFVEGSVCVWVGVTLQRRSGTHTYGQAPKAAGQKVARLSTHEPSADRGKVSPSRPPSLSRSRSFALALSLSLARTLLSVLRSSHTLSQCLVSLSSPLLSSPLLSSPLLSALLSSSLLSLSPVEAHDAGLIGQDFDFQSPILCEQRRPGQSAPHHERVGAITGR
jgi:hypothetical protein